MSCESPCTWTSHTRTSAEPPRRQGLYLLCFLPSHRTVQRVDVITDSKPFLSWCCVWAQPEGRASSGLCTPAGILWTIPLGLLITRCLALQRKRFQVDFSTHLINIYSALAMYQAPWKSKIVPSKQRSEITWVSLSWLTSPSWYLGQCWQEPQPFGKPNDKNKSPSSHFLKFNSYQMLVG